MLFRAGAMASSTETSVSVVRPESRLVASLVETKVSTVYTFSVFTIHCLLHDTDRVCFFIF